MRPYHPAVEAALEAVDSLCRRGFKSTEARRMVRVEIGSDVYNEILSAIGSIHYFKGRMNGNTGPINIMGIDFYFIAGLSKPDWRVINPLDT